MKQQLREIFKTLVDELKEFKTVETHLSDDLIGTLDQDLHRPPVVVGHPIQKPLKQRNTGRQ